MSRRLLLIFLLLVVGLISGITYKSANGFSMCGRDDGVGRDGVAVEDYPIIFIGKVLDEELKDKSPKEFKDRLIWVEDSYEMVILKVQVTDLLQGKLGKVVKVEAKSGTNADANSFRKGEEYIFFGHLKGQDEVSAVGRCEGTKEVTDFDLVGLRRKLEVKLKGLNL